MNRITLRDVPDYVRRKEVFMCNESLYAEWYGDLYSVYSYGDHFPVAVFDHVKRRWFINEDKYSVTTSNHQRRVFEGVGPYATTLGVEHLRTYIRYNGDAAVAAEKCSPGLRAAAELAPLLAVMQGLPLQEAVAA